ncbi:MAG: YtxH domain-containing protein [Leeuwenhoekiella sp.]
MASKNTKTGLLTLLGIAAGSVAAWWLYTNASPEEKERIKSKINEAGNKVKDAYASAEDAVVENFDKAKNTVEREADKVTR